MRIDKAEGLIARERDALAGRRQRRSVNGRCGMKTTGVADDGFEVDMLLGGIGQAIDQDAEVRMLPRLNKPEMPLEYGFRCTTANEPTSARS